MLAICEPQDGLTPFSKDSYHPDPLVVREEFIQPFKFWMDDQVRIGMRLQSELYCCTGRFTSTQRQQAFDTAWNLAQEGLAVVITAARSHYTVWKSLRSIAAASSLQP
ncbi:hypothetical protein BST81_13485 [Leptolyngbya sp. 'hensonii']|uniref:hypothetical protein n=1 Tax=Leptolyngbya sp. 'hensonii' TaxID=1922337 RepID=UPI000960DFE7|nr:hypothetical protein [Leptolyngbya sp. 'hensonii']OLP18039.1 hypothetical protein BST81_13485 [Leptolyngbya sp. 'hensonii']